MHHLIANAIVDRQAMNEKHPEYDNKDRGFDFVGFGVDDPNQLHGDIESTTPSHRPD